ALAARDSSAGIALLAGGSVTNQAGGTITGKNGIVGQPSVTVADGGRIVGAGPDPAAGIYLRGSGSITNQASGTITGYNGIVGVDSSPLYGPGPTTVVDGGSSNRDGGAGNRVGRG